LFFRDFFKGKKVEIKGFEKSFFQKFGMSTFFNSVEASLDEADITQATSLETAVS